LSQKEIEESLILLQKDWDVDPIIRDFMLGKITQVSDYAVKVKNVVFHVPYLITEKKYILWTCFWPDCHNCCDRQGRLPLTSDDLITIGKGLKYQNTSDFIKNETLTATYTEPGPSGQMTTMTTVNLKRKTDETELMMELTSLVDSLMIREDAACILTDLGMLLVSICILA